MNFPNSLKTANFAVPKKRTYLNNRTRRMKKNFLKVQSVAFIAMLFPLSLKAQDKVEAHIGADIVSGYIWRGQDSGNISIQPEISLGYKGVSITAWGSVGFDKEDAKELDLTLGYEYKGFSISVTDYWYDGGPGFFHFGATNTNHTFEAQIGYDFDFLAINWYTNFAGNDGLTANGNRAYASYISLSAPFRLGGLDWTAEVGATPWANSYYNANKGGANGFEVADVSISAAKEIKITSHYALPVSAKLTWNPATEDTYFVFGISF